MFDSLNCIQKKHMLRLLLLKKHILILLILLLTSIGYAKADDCVCNVFFDLSYAGQQDNIPKKAPGFYPNPVRDIVKLTNQDDVLRVRIISLTGKTFIDIKTKEKSINLSELSKGMYLINFDMKDGKRVARKLVKK